MSMVKEEELQRAAQALKAGELVAFPTETVYGLGAHALDERAVAAIFEAKGRPRFDPLIVHVLDLAGALPLLKLSETQRRGVETLTARFWPGPLTLVLPKSELVPDIVTAGQPTVAVRAPAHDVARALIAAAGLPIAAPSANRFCHISPTRAEHVAQQLGDKVSIILDGGPCQIGLESTIVSLANTLDQAPPLLLRPGGLPVEALTEVLGPLSTPSPGEHTSAAPGRQKKHYAPRAKMRLYELEAIEALGEEAKTAGLLSFRGGPHTARFAKVEVLSPSGDLREAAANLFAAMRRLDAHDLPLIVAETVPEEGLGRAIMDRLRRASA